MSTLTRREAIKKAALIVGGSLALPDILKAWGNLTIENPSVVYTPEQSALIAQIADTIVPDSATPGAIKAGVPAFIEKIVADCYEEKDRKIFFDGLAMVDAAARSAHGKGFVACSPAERVATLQSVEKTHFEDRQKQPFWRQMKELSVSGFFTSEIGCTQALRYEAVPGRYDGAFPYKKGDKAWAT